MSTASADELCSVETESVQLLDWHMLGALLSDNAQETGYETDSTGSFSSYDDAYTRRAEMHHCTPLGSSLDRASEILSKMNEDDRYTLLAPIRQGLLDPKSVFYLKDISGTQEIAISVEDLLYLVDQQKSAGENVQLLLGPDDFIDDNVPTRLADAVRHMSVSTQSGTESIYSVIDDGSSGYSSGPETRSERVNSDCTMVNSPSDSLFVPKLPSTRPPSSSLSLVFKRLHRQSKVLRW